MKTWLLAVAIWCWGTALTSFIGTTTRFVLGIIGIAAYLWYMREKRRTVSSPAQKPRADNVGFE
jgi:hypothetical protein